MKKITSLLVTMIISISLTMGANSTLKPGDLGLGARSVESLLLDHLFAVQQLQNQPVQQLSKTKQPDKV